MQNNFNKIRFLLRISVFIHLVVAILFGIFNLIRLQGGTNIFESYLTVGGAIYFVFLGVFSEFVLYLNNKGNYWGWILGICLALLLLLNPILVFLLGIFTLYFLLAEDVRRFYVNKIRKKSSSRNLILNLRIVSLYFFLKAVILVFSFDAIFSEDFIFKDVLIIRILFIFSILISFVIAVSAEVMVFNLERKKSYSLRIIKIISVLSCFSLIFPVGLLMSVKIFDNNSKQKFLA
ncbi:MAG: hypothetical protein GF347_05235 [Candidatus Moranbacteria bacterium]|nr:hypothetical protein [Candidatus Moranbacteria bacterium]